MNISENGKNLIKSFEGCILTAYKANPAEQYYTIGWGHYGSDVYAGMTITQSQADAMFDSDMVEYVNAVSSASLGFTPNQNQFDALCSFCYNLGTGIMNDFIGMTASQVANEIPLYTHGADGSVLPGLVTRRQKEVKLFNTTTSSSSSSTSNSGSYLNLEPHMTSWAVYNVAGPYTKDHSIGNLAPAQFGGLSYKILQSKANDIYIIRTDSWGEVAIWAPRDNDSSITNSPKYGVSGGTSTGGDGSNAYLNLEPHMTSWAVYNVDGPYTTNAAIGHLNPAQNGGLSYKIIDIKGNDVYIIHTVNFGNVAIWAPRDNDSSLTDSPVYGVSGGSSSTGQYLNLEPHMTSWAVYNIGGPYTTNAAIGHLNPAQNGGLSYSIIETRTNDVYIIRTSDFGEVAIWAPRDNDSSITSSPKYGNSGGTSTGGNTSSGGSTGQYLNLEPHMTSWAVYNVNGPYTKGNEIHTLAPSQFGGLSYKIIDSKGNDVYIINTESFGNVAIWAPRDNDSSITSSPKYGNSGGTSTGGGTDSDGYMSIYINGGTMSVKFSPHLIQIKDDENLKTILKVPSGAKIIAEKLRTEYRFNLGSSINISVESLAIEILAHVYADDFAKFINNIATVTKNDTLHLLANIVLEHTTVIDAGEGAKADNYAGDNNRWIWDLASQSLNDFIKFII